MSTARPVEGNQQPRLTTSKQLAMEATHGPWITLPAPVGIATNKRRPEVNDCMAVMKMECPGMPGIGGINKNFDCANADKRSIFSIGR